jgi:3-methylfumaryl-CoA hydratase
VHEEQDIIYLREPPRTPGTPAETPDPDTRSRSIELTQDLVGAPRSDRNDCSFEIDRVVLFRFSALTYNAHRIHYDSDYVRMTEGYPDLVVHGPLQALLMSEWARHNQIARLGSRPTAITYRLVSPLVLGQGLVVGSEPSGHVIATSVRDATGRITAHGAIQHAALVG